MKLLIFILCITSFSVFSSCIDFSGKYITNRGSYEDHTVLSDLIIEQQECKQLTFKFFPHAGHAFSKTYLLDGVEHISYDDGIVVIYEQAFLKDDSLIILGRIENRYDDTVKKTESHLYLDSDSNLSEYKYAFDQDGNQIATVITGFRRK